MVVAKSLSIDNAIGNIPELMREPLYSFMN